MNIFPFYNPITVTTQKETIQKIFYTYEDLNIIPYSNIQNESDGIFYINNLEIDMLDFEIVKKVKNRGLIVLMEAYSINTCFRTKEKISQCREFFDDERVLFIVQCKKDEEYIRQIFPGSLIGIRNTWLDEFCYYEYNKKRFDFKSDQPLPAIDGKIFSLFCRRFDYKRLEFFAELLKNDLLQDFHYSFSDYLGPTDKESFDKISNYIEVTDVIPNKTQVLDWLKSFPYELEATTDPTIQCAYPGTLEHYYHKSQFNIVYESYPHYSHYQSISEKTYKAFFYKKPFILVCHPNELKSLHLEGYKTFAEVIDESYDEIENYQDRVNAIVKEIKRLQQMSNNERTQILDFCKDIVRHNYETLIDHVHNNNIDPSVNIDKVIKNIKAM